MNTTQQLQVAFEVAINKFSRSAHPEVRKSALYEARGYSKELNAIYLAAIHQHRYRSITIDGVTWSICGCGKVEETAL